MRNGQIKGMEADVLCPFYKWHERQRVNCEGVSGGSILGQQFASGGLRERFMLEKCAEAYKTCPVYGLLIEKKYPEARE